MPEYSGQGAAQPRFVPGDDAGSRVSQPGARSVPPPAETQRAGRAEPWRAAAARKPAAAPGLRLTGRGAILCLFVLSFLGILLAGGLGTELVADALFLIGCGAMAWYTKPSDLLPVTVSPPLAFFFACLLAKLISSSGGTSAAEGVLVTLATSAPWLFAGTALTIVIALRRGLLDNIRELRQGLRGTPGEMARADERARRR